MHKDELDITVGVRVKATGTAVPMGVALGITSLFFGGVLALWAGGSGTVAIVAMLLSPAATLSATYMMLRSEPKQIAWREAEQRQRIGQREPVRLIERNVSNETRRRIR